MYPHKGATELTDVPFVLLLNKTDTTFLQFWLMRSLLAAWGKSSICVAIILHRKESQFQYNINSFSECVYISLGHYTACPLHCYRVMSLQKGEKGRKKSQEIIWKRIILVLCPVLSKKEEQEMTRKTQNVTKKERGRLHLPLLKQYKKDKLDSIKTCET